MSDSLLYELSASTGALPEPFIKREIAWVPDSNNGSYQSTSLTIDLAGIANSQKWSSFKEAVLQIPLVLTLLDTTDGNVANSDVANLKPEQVVGLKSNYAHIFHSFSVKLNNTQIIDQTDFTSIPMTFKLLTQLGVEDQEKYGASLGFFKDNVNFLYDDGNVYNNGASGPVTFTSGRNQGMQNRRAFTTGLTVPSASTDGSDDILTDSNYLSTFAQPGWEAPDATKNYRIAYVVAQVRLMDLHPFFAEVPLVKGGYLWMNFVMNQATASFKWDNTHGFDALTTNINSNGVLPFMLSPPSTATGLKNGRNYRVSIGVVQPYDATVRSAGGASHPAFNQVRCYMPLYIMDASKYAEYEALGEEREIRYSDFSRPGVPVQTAGSTFSTILSSGINRLKSVLVAPMFNSATGGNVEIIAYQSPLTTEPSTCSPLARIGNYNVQLSGTNVYQEDENYSFQFFQDEIATLGTNGQLTPGITSGLINKYDWERMYGFLYTDCSRRLGPAFESATSVVIKGVNKTSVDLSLETFMEYERRLIVNVFSGQVKSRM
jgi:hypothetical protein